jgi:penicillin amidase
MRTHSDWTRLLICTLAAGAIAACGGSDSDPDPDPDDPVEVSITRDAHGVPHIVAATDAGAFYGLGYATADDRLLHMNINVWAIQGRMAEALGASHVDLDIAARLRGDWRHAQKVAANLDEPHRDLLQAYADGVNAWLDEHPDDINDLFDTLGMEPEVWTPAHSIAAWWRIAAFFANDPTGQAEGYYEFMDMVTDSGLDRALDAFGGEPHTGDPSAAVVQQSDVPSETLDAVSAYAASLGYGPDAQAFGHSHPSAFGHDTPRFSHAWAVGGSATSTGKAVVISDPQVPVMFPNLMYEWHLTGATLNVRGIGVPGAAGLLIGFNDHLAWGMTAAGAAQRDLFRLDMVDATTYLVDDEQHTLVSEDEVIRVAGGTDVTVTYKSSIWGPVVTPLVGTVRGTDEFAIKGIPYSEDATDTFVGMLAMMRADTVNELLVATDGFRYPSANLIAGDDQGSVMYTLVGAIPVRSVQSPLGGAIAQEGTSDIYDWQDIIPYQFKPHVIDPADGWLASANHRVVDAWPLPLGVGTGSGGHTSRSRRLYEMLDALPAAATPQQVADSTQHDCVNAQRRDMVAILRHVQAGGNDALNAETTAALDHLDAWSATGGSGLTGNAGVFLASKISTKFRVNQTGEAINETYGGGENGLSLFLDTLMATIAADPDARIDADSVRYLDQTLTTAWTTAMGASADSSTWDALYASGSQTNPVYSYFADDLALLGDAVDTGIEVAAPTLQCADGQTIWSQLGQTYSHVVDLNDVDSATSVLAPGNTEGPDDDAWQSQLDDWATGTLKPAPISIDASGAIADSELVLTYDPASD